MNVLGLKVRGHDPGAALISNGEVVAIAEERLVRIKHADEIFPTNSIRYCLEAFGLESKDIDLVVIEHVGTKLGTAPRAFSEYADSELKKVRIELLNHHLAHAASAFFVSPFEEAAVLVCDGAGSRFIKEDGLGYSESETLFHGRGTEITEIKKALRQREYWPEKTFPDPCGIGNLYGYYANNYCGLGPDGDGKMMGLVAYGNDSILQKVPMHHWGWEEDGVWNCEVTTRSTLRKPGRPLLETPKRTDEELPDDYYASVAYAVQKVAEEGMLWWARKAKEETEADALCMAGGVALNIDANKRILSEGPFSELFVQPAATDAGLPLGCALWGYCVVLKQPRLPAMRSASLGRVYNREEINAAIHSRANEIVVEQYAPEEIARKTAGILASGQVVAWFQGGAEYGPRALGNRSILADPRTQDMKDRVNRVKSREWWRPFGASILLERTPEWFDLETESPFMLLAAMVREEKRSAIPAVLHVDGTSRLQTLTKEDNGRYYDLVHAFKEKTGVPLILNTSFNLAGEPIVETPEDALDTFLKSDADALVIEDRIIRKHPPFVSVVIPVYNDKENLTQCLAALEKQTYPRNKFEVLVVDNGSTDEVDTVRFAKNVSHIHEPKPGSYAARNTGIRHVRGEIIAFTDSDCVPDSQWIEEGVRCMQEHSAERDAIGGAINLVSKKKKPNAVELYDRHFGLNQKQAVEKGSFAFTANMFVRSTLFQQIGFFNEDAYSGEDARWFTESFKSGGYTLCYGEKALVEHPTQHSLASLLKKHRRYVGGHFMRLEYHDVSWVSIWKPVFFGALRQIQRTWQTQTSLSQRIKLLAVEVCVQTVRALEILRLRLGGASRRS